jgi:hypothetical protein
MYIGKNTQNELFIHHDTKRNFPTPIFIVFPHKKKKEKHHEKISQKFRFSIHVTVATRQSNFMFFRHHNLNAVSLFYESTHSLDNKLNIFFLGSE